MLPEAHALNMAKRACGSRSLDVCSGIGAMSVALARSGQQVTAVEIDEGRVAMARHNAGIYDVADRIDFRHADIISTATLQSLPEDIDTLFLDPPWGDGPGDYLHRQVTYLEDLQLANVDLRVLVGNITCREVMIRLPPNFDIGIFRQTRGEKIAYVTQTGYLHWYYIRMPKQEFVGIPAKGASHLSLEESREGFEAYFLRE